MMKHNQRRRAGHRSGTAIKQAWVIALAILSAGGCAMPGGGLLSEKQGQGPVGSATEPVAASQKPAPSTLTESPVQQVGFRASLSDASCGNGGACAECKPGACQSCPPVQPHGYAPVPMVYNPYGIDPQEFLCDGGDQMPSAFLRQDDSIAALDPEDTVVHFTTDAGDIEFAESNRVCVYAPRFAAVRRVTGAVSGDHVVGATGIERPVGPVRINVEQPGLVVSDNIELGHAEVAKRIDAMRERNRGIPIEGVLQPIMAEEFVELIAAIRVLELTELRDAELPLLEQAATAAIAWTIEESVEAAIQEVAPPELVRDRGPRGFTTYDFGTGRLVISKFADKHHAQPGEIVEFALRVDNVGDGPVNQVTITDNLTTRLEYIADSQEASCEADFKAVENDVESSQLIWTLTKELAVGESVLLRFKCRVR